MQKRTAGGYVALAASHRLRREEERQSLMNHHESIIKARPRLNTWNDTFVAVHHTHRSNRRRNRFDEEKQAKIQKENQILVQKMTQSVFRGPNQGPGGAPLPYPAASPAPPPQHATLNYLNRKHERDRILKANLVLAKRLIEQKPRLSNQDWRSHSSEHTRLRQSISKFAEVEAEELAATRRRRKHQTAVALPPIRREEDDSSSELVEQSGQLHNAERGAPAQESPKPSPTRPKPVPRYLQDYRLNYGRPKNSQSSNQP